MKSDVPHSSGSEKGITNGVKQHIRITVAECTFFVGNQNTAKPEFPAFF
jgi:hypothetical protein